MCRNKYIFCKRMNIYEFSRSSSLTAEGFAIQRSLENLDYLVNCLYHLISQHLSTRIFVLVLRNAASLQWHFASFMYEMWLSKLFCSYIFLSFIKTMEM